MTEHDGCKRNEPTIDEWRKAFDNAPACHHSTSPFETISAGALPDIALSAIERMVASRIEEEVILVEEVDAIIDDLGFDEQQ